MFDPDDLNKQTSLAEYFMYQNVIDSADEGLSILNIVADPEHTVMFSDSNLTLIRYAESEVENKVKELTGQ